MTEAEWLECTDPQKLLQAAGMRLDPRLRRIAVECCRRVRHLLSEEAFRVAADAGEAFADDPQNWKGTIRAMAEAGMQARRYRRLCGVSLHPGQLHAANAAIATCAPTDWHAAFNGLREASQAVTPTRPGCCDPVEMQYQAALFRDIFGNPFRPATFDPSCHTPTVTTLAQTIYDERRFDDLPILADALEEAGCTNGDILGHLRGPGPHVRGCFVVDLLLGKE